MRSSTISNSLLFLVMINLSLGNLFAQCFDADVLYGCPPHTINVTNCGDPAIPVFYDYGDNSGVSFSGSHTYTAPGTYTVTQYAGTGNNIDTLKKTNYITVYDNPTPAFTLFNCANNSVRISIDEDIYDQYIIDYGDGNTETVTGLQTVNKTYVSSTNQTVTVTGRYLLAPCTNSSQTTTSLFTTLQPANITRVDIISSSSISINIDIEPIFEYKVKRRLQGTTTFEVVDTIPRGSSINSYTYTGLDTENEVYEFELETFDRCGLSVNSNRVNNILLDVSVNTSNITSVWSNYSGSFDHFELLINRTNNDVGSQTSYVDIALTCNQSYCYQIVAFETPTDPISYSQTICVTSPIDSDPQPIDELLVSVDNNTTNLRWTSPIDVKNYTWSRNNTSLGTFTSTNGSKQDPTANTSENNCYTLNYTDLCNNTPSTAVSACQLNLEIIRSTSESIDLSWTSYNTFLNGLARYTIQFFDENFTLLQEIDNGTSTTYSGTTPSTPNGVLNIKIIAVSTDGKSVNSNIETITFTAQVFFPNAFTPNGDGLNDTFIPVNQFVDTYDLYIYTRQGEVIFHSDNVATGWDGKLPNGTLATSGVYTYVAEVTGVIGNKFTKKGTFTLLN